jgi:isopentenyl diphosphate isomerase/L-lactate dehydrogenase-like FMN-dependent dehydrogenase
LGSVDFDALEQRAREKMSPAAFAFCAAGADDEISTNENIIAWRALRLRPRVLNDVAAIDTSVTLLGGL